MNDNWTAQRLGARRLVELLGEWRGSGHGYLELAGSIALLVRDNRIAAGTALPAERPLADALGVSRTTVAAAYRHLRETGAVRSRRGSGTVVRGAEAGTAELWSGSGSGIDLASASPEAWEGLPELGTRALAEHSQLFRLPGYDTRGLPALRAAIADRYTARGLATAPEQIMVTLGAQHAIFLIARSLLRRGDRSLIESPSYPHAREALAATGALVAELPLAGDASGGSGGSGGAAAWYDSGTMLEIADRATPRVTYLIPDHHNPTGLSMPPELKPRLIAALAGRGGFIVVDETTAELTLGEVRPVRPFAAFAELPHHREAILTVGSLGKTAWGGLRVGWIRAEPELIDRLETARRSGDLGTGTWEQVLSLLALERYDEILAYRTRQLTARHRFLVDRLADALPEWTPAPAGGGVCLWVDLGARLSTRLSRAAAAHDVHLPPGPRFGTPGVFERYTRLPFSLPEPDLATAVERLARAWRDELGAPEGGAAPQLPEAVI